MRTPHANDNWLCNPLDFEKCPIAQIEKNDGERENN